MDVRVGLWRKLSAKELMLLNCGVGEDSWESLEQCGNQTRIFTGRTNAEVPILQPPDWRASSLEKTLILGKIEGRRRRGCQRMRWWDGITNSVDIVWANSGSWWWTGKPGVLQSMSSQKVGHDWATELNWGWRSSIQSAKLRPGADWLRS